MTEVSVGIEVATQMQMFQKRVIGTAQKLVEDVEISLVGVLMNNARLLQQIVQDIASVWNSLPVDKVARYRYLIPDKQSYQLKLMSIYFPKRDELLLRFVFALPNASRIGFVCKSLSLTLSTLSMCPEAAAMNCRTFFDASVFPEPDSP